MVVSGPVAGVLGVKSFDLGVGRVVQPLAGLELFDRVVGLLELRDVVHELEVVRADGRGDASEGGKSESFHRKFKIIIFILNKRRPLPNKLRRRHITIK